MTRIGTVASAKGTAMSRLDGWGSARHLVVVHGLWLMLLAVASLEFSFGVAMAAPGPSSTRVPRVHGMDVERAYSRLHAAHLRVSVASHFTVENYTRSGPQVMGLTPAAGRSVARNSVISARLKCGCFDETPGVPPGKLPRYVMPAFVGRAGSSVSGWARGKLVALDFRFGRLTAGEASTLLRNYVVVKQSPSAGRKVSFGRRLDGGAFRVQPITVWLRQGRPRRSAGSAASPRKEAHGLGQYWPIGVAILFACCIAAASLAMWLRKRTSSHRAVRAV